MRRRRRQRRQERLREGTRHRGPSPGGGGSGEGIGPAQEEEEEEEAAAAGGTERPLQSHTQTLLRIVARSLSPRRSAPPPRGPTLFFQDSGVPGAGFWAPSGAPTPSTPLRGWISSSPQGGAGARGSPAV